MTRAQRRNELRNAIGDELMRVVAMRERLSKLRHRRRSHAWLCANDDAFNALGLVAVELSRKLDLLDAEEKRGPF